VRSDRDEDNQTVYYGLLTLTKLKAKVCCEGRRDEQLVVKPD
jgi:hypothetical protein